jgi:type I restriction enzyme S subunit
MLNILAGQGRAGQGRAGQGRAGQLIVWAALGEVAIYSETRIEASRLNSANYVGVDNLLPDKMGKTLSSHVPTSGKFTRFDAGDILIGNIRPYLKKIWRAAVTGGTNGDVLVIRIKNNKNIMPNYLYYLLSSDEFFHYDMQYAKGAKMPRGNKQAILKYPIPIPPLKEQERIVSILDRFDALTTDITSGLPAEITARQKQYEYYRDKLLQFTINNV